MRTILRFLFPLILLTACRTDIIFYPPQSEQHGDTIISNLSGFYLLNQGNMGGNKATLDYYDFASATYTRNIYSERNPTVPLALGDVGNDMLIYGNRLYCVINVSNKIEVLTADSAYRTGQINVPNCRYLCFDGPYGYITSYAGPVQVGKQHAQLGYVARFDTATLQILDTCFVGYQPDGISIANNHIFVANSGGYLAPNYENTLSVIDLQTFKEETRITVAPNLHYIKSDQYGTLWVNSRGDEYNIPSRLYSVDPTTLTVTDSVSMPVTNFTIQGDSLYFFGSEFNWSTLQQQYVYGIINIDTHQILTTCFLPADLSITHPYAIAVNPLTKHIYIADSKDYLTPGTLYCIDSQQTPLWQVRTGDIPACIAFVYTNQ